MGICGDWFGMKYSRWVHLVLLIELLVLYALVICLVFLRDGELQVRVYWFVAFGAVVFLGLWILRGLRSLDGCFPAFHYSTLLLELVIHLVSYEISFILYTKRDMYLYITLK